MDSPADDVSKPRSDGGGKSPPIDLSPDASLSRSEPSLDLPSVVENPSSDVLAPDFGNGVPIPVDHDSYISGSPDPCIDDTPDPCISTSEFAPDNRTTIETVKDAFSRWGRKVGDTAKSAEDLSRNTWQHLKTGPSFVEAAMGRIAQGTKVLAEGGYEKIFRHTFESFPEEKLKNSYACYLSTSAGPIMGVLYLSTVKLAFCSDSPLPYKAGDQTEWSYYKVVVPLHQIRSSSPSTNTANSAEKYIQIVTADHHEFWFMGFLNYEGAVENLQEATRELQDT